MEGDWGGSPIGIGLFINPWASPQSPTCVDMTLDSTPETWRTEHRHRHCPGPKLATQEHGHETNPNNTTKPSKMGLTLKSRPQRRQVRTCHLHLARPIAC